LTVEVVDGELRLHGDRFEYRTPLPWGVGADCIDASLENGILTVRVPTRDRAPHRVEVNGH
jgi:HSP20 family molecular chaperone IbpA